MNTVDIIGMVSIYIYVFIILLISEKLLKERPSLSRKFVHIMVGNLIFAMPLFSDIRIVAYFLTIPLTVVTFFLTDYSPIKISNTATESGHSLGLVYYAGTWSALLLILPNQLWIIGLAVASMVYGDGFASLIGEKFGKIKYNLTGDTKSLEGSLTMFVISSVMGVFIWMFYASLGYHMPQFNIIAIIGISAVATIVEAITPGGLDNVTACISTGLLYYLLIFI